MIRVALAVGLSLSLTSVFSQTPKKVSDCGLGKEPTIPNPPYQCKECDIGQYCPAKGVPMPVNYGQWVLGNLCPEGYYCPNSTVAIECEAGYFCPNGTAGLGGVYNNTCDVKGLYCPSGAKKPLLCPKGYFCETTKEKTECPSGSWCGEGVAQPRDCAILTFCSAGSSTPGIGLLGISVLVIVLIVRAGVYYFYFFKKKQEQTEFQETITQIEAEPGSPTSLNSNLSTATTYQVERPFYVTFQGMKVTLNNGLDILSNVNGVFQPGRMCAVMGPSGAGKSTLLTALLGTNTANTSGNILINGEATLLSEFSTEVAFVPQDDIVLSELTVTENLAYSAAWRLPPSTTAEERRAVVASTIKLLGLTHVKDTIVGDPEHRGISGGQRKRVNIGCELVAHPGVIFLDEPTSGLDATSSLDILTALKRMAVDSQISIVAVIHQPRMSIFEEFDDVLLLAKGGRTVYMGETKGVIPYFNTIGYQVPEMENPADFLMDAIAGEVETFDHRPSPDLVTSWMEYESQGTVSSMIKEKEALAEKIGCPARRTTPNIFKQGLVFVQRSINQIIRRPGDLAVDFMLIVLGSAGTGFVFGPNGTWDIKRLEAVCLFSSLVLGLLSCMAALSVFGAERLFFFREYTAGLNIVPYFFAKNIVMVYDIFLRSFVFCLIFYNFAQFYMSFFHFYMFLCALVYSCSGLGYLISQLISPRNALLAAVVIPFVLGGMFSGFLPSLQSLKDSAIRSFISYFSFGRWSLEGLVVAEYNAYPDALKHNARLFLNERGYDLEWSVAWTSVSVLVIQGAFYRLLSIFVMWADRRRLATLIRDKLIAMYKDRKNPPSETDDMKQNLL